MYRQSPSRNQRSKGIRVKNVLQICLLLAGCFWLIYQVKHSHDKKKELEESDFKSSRQRTSGHELIKLGRKDIRPRLDDRDNHDEPAEEEETSGEEVEENKRDEDESEDKDDEMDHDEASGRDVETEEHEQEKSDAEIDIEQGLGDGEENETQETDSGEGHGPMEKENTVDDTDHDADDASAHEAREEHYKADDASSAVTHDNQMVTENENEHIENSNEQPGNNLEEKNDNNSEETYESESSKDLEVEGSEAAGDGHQSNVKTEEDTLHDSESGSTPDDEVTEGSNVHFMSNGTTELTISNNDLPPDNLTGSLPEIGHGQGNVTEGASSEGSGFQNVDPQKANNSSISVDGTQLDSNSTDSAGRTDAAGSHSEKLSGSSINTTDSSVSEDSRLEAERGNTTESSNNEFEGEKSDSSDGTDESLETTSTDNPEEVREDAIDITDISISNLEKEILTDLDSLSDIQTEGTNSEDVAAE